MKQYLIEYICTFFLTLIIALTGNPLAIGIGLIALVYAGGAISGAHYNPAVTFALFLRKKITQQEAIRYIVAQLAGSISASIITVLIFMKDFSVRPGDTVTWSTAVSAEALFTFLLVFVVLHVAASKKTQSNHYFGLAIGGTVFAGATAVGNISGGAFNPAVGIGPLISNVFLSKSFFDPSLLFLYIIGPIIGSIAAAWVHKITQE